MHSQHPAVSIYSNMEVNVMNTRHLFFFSMFACIIPVLRLTGLTFTSTKPTPFPFPSIRNPHKSVNFAGVRRPRVSSTQSTSIMLHHDPVMRARSGHRPSFFFCFVLFFFSLPFCCVCSGSLIFPLLFGANKNLLFFHAAEQVGSPGVGHSASFPHCATCCK